MRIVNRKPEVYADSLFNLAAFLDECYGLLPWGTYRLRNKLKEHLQKEEDYEPCRANVGSVIVILKNKREIDEMLSYLELRKRSKMFPS
ncbi:MAG: hypothetical protein IKE52_07240 [Mogibacterium sp.]|nr:hypothetical protein [Mogibacterium sp.]